jgi:hypothetical protein
VTDERVEVAEQIRRALIERALAAFEDASMQGLCCEGAWEAAISALRHVELEVLLEPPPGPRRNEDA